MGESQQDASSRRHSLRIDPRTELSSPEYQKHSPSLGSQARGTRRRTGKAPVRSHSIIEDRSAIKSNTDRPASRKIRSEAGPPGPSNYSGAFSRRSSTSSESSSEKESGSFFPKLGRILEDIEGGSDRRPTSSIRTKDRARHHSRSLKTSDGSSTQSKRPTRRSRNSLEQHAEDIAGLIHSNPSLLSVFSSITTASGASSGSNSTITQKSYDRANISKRKRTKERSSRKADKTVKASRNLDDREAANESQKSSDVFQYMQQPSTASTSRLVDMAQFSGTTSGATLPNLAAPHWKQSMDSYPSPPVSVHSPHHDDSELHSDRVHSDSGISVRGSSPDIPDTPLKPADIHRPEHHASSSEDDEFDDSESEDEDAGQPPGPPGPPRPPLQIMQAPPSSAPEPPAQVQDDPRLQRLREQEAERYRHIFHSPSPIPYHMDPRFGPGAMSPRPPAPFVHPQPFQYIEPPSRHPMSPAPLYHPQPGPPPIPVLPGYTQAPPYQPQDTVDRTKTTITGYEMMALRLTAASHEDQRNGGSETITPVYRRFEHLNHRVLLHLQDEITELEEDLRYDDETIAQITRANPDGTLQPASRRGDSQFVDTICYRRTELLGRIYLKLQQYNQAIASFNSIKGIGNADPENVAKYSAWLEENAPVEQPEMQFLQSPADLLCLRPAQNSTGPPTHAAPRTSTPAETAPLFKDPVTLTLALLLVSAFVLPVLFSFLVQDVFARAVVMFAIAASEACLLWAMGLYDALPVATWSMIGSVYFAFLACSSAVRWS